MNLVSGIGERMILFRLYSLIYDEKHLEIFKNYSGTRLRYRRQKYKDQGKVKIEVKTAMNNRRT